ncbi:NADH-quinone oxidoreductase subunit K [Marinobacter salicampi]|uniref:NADH-quinone oxidoreductase subunit K n=1 Tax=Marinobacter salicampi TaxID=435907 RepID=UPI00140B2F8F|nr:NADH-quinone oxidoreductase subunit K [Marinobacter salicampi]
MSAHLLYAFGGVVLCGMGLGGFILLSHLLRKLLAFNIMGSGIFLILVGLAQHGGGAEPGMDPVPQALVLTGIVVAVSATALALVLIRRYYYLTGQTVLESSAESGRRNNDDDPGSRKDGAL